jgi:hypothetical protein
MKSTSKAPRRRPTDREHQEQCRYFEWLFYFDKTAYGVAYAIANGGQRNVVVAAKLKREGVKAGVLDLNIDLPRGGYHGLRIEFKATPPHSAPVSKLQKEWLAKQRGFGYYADVAKGLHHAREITEQYLSLPLSPIKTFEALTVCSYQD